MILGLVVYPETKDLFRTHSNIYDGAFFQK